MSICDNETSKICPGLNPTAPVESQTYCLDKLTRTEAFFPDKIEAQEKTGQKMKRFGTIMIVDRGRITSAVITEGISIAAFTSGISLPVGIALSGTIQVLSLATLITRKSTRTFTVKQEKLDSIKLLAQSKLDSMTNIISQATQDGDISRTEFHKVLQEREIYRKLNPEIRNQTKAKVKQIIKGQRKELLKEGKKEDKEDFLRKIAVASGTQGASAI